MAVAVSADLPAPAQLRVLQSGDATYQAMLAAIGEAKHDVFLEVYNFKRDRTGNTFLEVLTRAAARGVKVAVIMDAWGTDDSARIAEQLRRSGCTAKVYNPLVAGLQGHFQRDHRKLMVVDDEVAFLGGINISDDFVGDNGWADLALELRGPAARALARQLRGGKQTRRLADVHVVLSTSGARAVRRRYLRAIDRAKERIVMAHAYFLPDRRLLRAIRKAARRGVAVSLLLPGKSDVPMTHALTRLYHRSLLRAGVKIYEWAPSILHAKAAVIDGEVALIGSFNFDPWSLLNLEVLAEVHRPDVAAEIERWIMVRIAGSPLVRSRPPSRLVAPLERLGQGFVGISWRVSRRLSRWTRERLP